MSFFVSYHRLFTVVNAEPGTLHERTYDYDKKNDVRLKISMVLIKLYEIVMHVTRFH